MAGPIAPLPRYRGLLASQDRGAGQLVGGAWVPYQGVAGGAFFDVAADQAARRQLANQLNALALRQARQQRRGPLAPRGPRPTVVGGVTTARPMIRAGSGS